MLFDEIKRQLKESPSLCLYGAGDYAEMYFSVLEALGRTPSKVIVTSKNKEYFHDVRIETAAEACLSDDIIIIGAYDGASESAIRDNLKCNNEIIVFSDEEIFGLYNELVLNPLLHSFSTKNIYNNNKSDLQDLKKILVVRLDVLGDLVMTTAFIRELKVNCPDAEISLIVRSSNASLFENCPYISELIIYDCPGMNGTLSSQIRAQSEIEGRIDAFISEKLDGQKYDAVFLPREILKGRNCYEEFLLALRIDADHRIGRIREFENDQAIICNELRELFYLICQNEIVQEAEYMLGMVKNLGGEIHSTNLELWSKGSLSDELTELFQSGTKYVILGLQASNASRTWPADKYGELIELMNHQYGSAIKFLLIGDASSPENVRKLAKYDNTIDLIGKTSLSELAEIMKKADIYIGSNTGLMHMAAAAQLPCITLYATLPGIKDTDGNSAFRMGAWDTERIDLFPDKALDDCCEMCRKNYAHCITQITPQMVFEAVKDIMLTKVYKSI